MSYNIVFRSLVRKCQFYAIEIIDLPMALEKDTTYCLSELVLFVVCRFPNLS